jgi:hypothetical protein
MQQIGCQDRYSVGIIGTRYLRACPTPFGLRDAAQHVKTPTRHTVTAALPYANGPLHIGHIAGAYLPADIYVRNLRQRGKEVLFICGSDEHGAAITMRAMKEGTTPPRHRGQIPCADGPGLPGLRHPLRYL